MKYIKILTIVLLFFFSFQEVHALAVTQPMPSDLTLKRGDTIPFKFEIQAISSKEDQICTYSISGLKPIKVGFDKEEALVKTGNILDVFGTLEVPVNAPTKEYEGNLIVNCKPDIVSVGVSLIAQTTEIPFLVKVIESEEVETPYWEYFLVWIFIGIAIVLPIWLKFKHKSGLKDNHKKGRKID